MLKKLQIAGFLLGALGLGLAAAPRYAFAQVSSCTTSLSVVSATLADTNTPSSPIDTTLVTHPEQLAGIGTNPLPTDVSQAFVTPTPSPITEAIVQPFEQVNSAVTQFSSPASVSSTSLNGDLIFSMINSYRNQAGLPSFIKTDAICQIASARAPQIYNEVMVTGMMHAGFYALHLPYRASENIIYMRSETEAVNWWLNSPIHRAAIYGEYKYSCVACSGNSCSEIFADY